MKRESIRFKLTTLLGEMMMEQDIKRMIENDEWMMNVLKAAQTLNLPDWWICAGFVFSKIWDTLHGFNERTPLSDVDVIYYDPLILEEEREKIYEEKLYTIMPDIPWSVKNEARMHLKNKIPPYTSSEDAISKFPETATALGVKLDNKRELVLTAPWGFEDVVEFNVKPTPHFLETQERMEFYKTRVTLKRWESVWNKVKVLHT